MAKISKKTKLVKKKVAALVVKKLAKTKAIKPAKKTGGTQKVSAAAGKRLNANSVVMEFILIPAGKFKMARGGKYPKSSRVSVTLTQSFGLGKYEVTQGQWKSVMGTEPWDGKSDVKADKDCPATYVSWDDATEFCEKLTAIKRKAGKLKADEEYRLPTEAEWEYACRAGTTTAFSFGDDEKQLGDYAWFRGNADDVDEKYAHKVGMKKPNPWGLYDMHGNAAEWCLDSYEDELYPCAAAYKDVDYIHIAVDFSTDPVGREGSIRVFRGGCWGDYPGSCRSASASMDVLSGDPNQLGFRVARSQSVQ